MEENSGGFSEYFDKNKCFRGRNFAKLPPNAVSRLQQREVTTCMPISIVWDTFFYHTYTQTDNKIIKCGLLVDLGLQATVDLSSDHLIIYSCTRSRLVVVAHTAPSVPVCTGLTTHLSYHSDKQVGILDLDNNGQR